MAAHGGRRQGRFGLFLSLSLLLVLGCFSSLDFAFGPRSKRGMIQTRGAPLALAVCFLPCFRRGRPMICSVLASVDCFPPTHRVYQLDLS